MVLPVAGLTTPRQPIILENIGQSQRSLVDPNITNTPDTVIGQTNTVFSLQLARAFELLQAIYDSRNINAASGKALDDLVSILNIIRQGTFPTRGEQYFTASRNNTVIPTNSEVRSIVTNQRYFLPAPLTITASNCRESVMSVLVVNNFNYSVTVEGTQHPYPSGANATAAEIVQGLSDHINANNNGNYTSEVVGNTLRVFTENRTELTVILSQNMTFSEVTSAANVEAVTGGAIVQAANSVATIVTPVGNWIRTTNPDQYSTGRDTETDQELRDRVRLQLTATGLATPDAIISRIRNIAGVSFTSVTERFLSEGTDPVTNQPAGSIFVVIAGGDDNEVGQALWDAHGAGVQTFGAITVPVSDANGDIRSVSFSRPLVVPSDGLGLYVRTTYTIFQEEVWPGDVLGQLAIRQAIVDFGNTLGIGNDVIGKRFFGRIYESVQGIEDLNVQVSSDGVSFVDVLDIGDNQVPQFFLNDRITAAEI